MKTLLTLNELVSAVKGQVIGKNTDCFFTSVQTDSRFVEKDTLFVPLIGEFQDGHKYIPQAVEKGATVIFVNNSNYESSKTVYEKMCNENPSVVFVVVENTLHALQNAAQAYVSKAASNMIKISITGSSGKTTTKEMIVSVCKAHFGESGVAYTKGNFNSETGLPLSVFHIRGDEKVGIFEMGMNRENEIGEISAVLKSKYGIITNIGNAHIGILGSRENIAKEKRKSFDYIPADGAACVPISDDFADYCTENVKGKIIKYGKNVPESVSGVNFIEDLGLNGTKFSVDGTEIILPLSGEYNYSNALGVIAIAKELGISAAEIKLGLENMSAVNGRMESSEITLSNNKKVTLIADCYNANPDSMEKVLSFCGTLNVKGRKILVLGDMKELGDEAEKAHQKIADLICQIKSDFVIIVGSEMKACEKRLSDFASKGMCLSTVKYYENNDEGFYKKAASQILDFAKDNDLILLKASHSMALEKIIPLIKKEEVNA